MSKISIVESYINRCTEEHTMDSAKKLVNDIIGVFSNDINGLTSKLDLYNVRHMAGGTTVNYVEDVELLSQKLEFYKSSLIESEMRNDPLWEFKQMVEQDLQNLLSAKSDPNNNEIPETAKQQLYKEITAKYHAIIPNLGSGLYQYYAEQGFYEEVFGDSLSHNIDQIYHKLTAFKITGYPGVIKKTETPLNQFIISNDSKASATATATVTISISNTIEAINQLPHDVINKEEKEKLKDDLYTLEGIKTTKNKSEFWEKAKPVLTFLADKGADAMLVAAPYIIKALQTM